MNSLQTSNQTMSCAKRFEQFVPCVEPLLAELALNDDMNWWLLDSGASVTVLSETFAKSYGAQTKSLTVGERFRAANGTSGTMKGLARLSVDLLMFDEANGKEHWKSASLEVHVGSTSHNILSTTMLCRAGWCFVQRPDNVVLTHVASGFVAGETATYAGCPWVRLYPSVRGMFVKV